MGYLDSIVTPSQAPSGGNATPVPTTGYLGGVSVPTGASAARASSINNMQGQSQVETANANYANSLPGILKAGIVSPIQSYLSQGVQQAKDLGTTIMKDPVAAAIKAFQAPTKQIGEAAQAGVDTASEGMTGLAEGYGKAASPNASERGSTPGDVANLAKIAGGVASTLFSPITGLFNTAEKVPGLKQAADAFNLPFTVTGMAGAYGTGKIIDVLPISQQSKDILKGPLENLGSLALQVSLGGKIMDMVHQYASTGAEITPEIAQEIVDNVKPKEPAPKAGGYLDTIQKPEVQQQSLSENHTAYANSQGYEPYTSPENLPVIQMGSKAKEALPTINADAAPKTDTTPPPGYKYESLQQPKTPPAETGGTNVPAATKVSPEGTYRPPMPIESTGELTRSKLASSVDANAVANKLSDGIGLLPEYNKVDMKEQAQFATDLVHNEPDKAMRIAMGQEAPPAHILPESVFTAIEDKATREGDSETLRRIATESNMSSQATAMGQRIRALAEREDLSPVKGIQEVAKARENSGGPDKVKSEVASIKKEIAKSAPTKEDWSSFIESVKCGY